MDWIDAIRVAPGGCGGGWLLVLVVQVMMVVLMLVVLVVLVHGGVRVERKDATGYGSRRVMQPEKVVQASVLHCITCVPERKKCN